MPVEIRELIIRATVSGSEYPGSEIGLVTDRKTAQIEREELVKACVEQVLDILKDKQER